MGFYHTYAYYFSSLHMHNGHTFLQIQVAKELMTRSTFTFCWTFQLPPATSHKVSVDLPAYTTCVYCVYPVEPLCYDRDFSAVLNWTLWSLLVLVCSTQGCRRRGVTIAQKPPWPPKSMLTVGTDFYVHLGFN